MRNNVFIFLLLIFSSCGIQKRMNQTRAVVDLAKNNAKQEKENLASLQQQAAVKYGQNEIDSSISGDYDRIFNNLNHRIAAIEKQIEALEAYTTKRSNFLPGTYYGDIDNIVYALDSFNLLKEKRERLYQFINDAVSIDAFSVYKLAAFFEPGVYRIPADASKIFDQNFSSAVDTLVSASNKYDDVPRVARLIFVGYADESPVEENSKLYKELKHYTPVEKPNREELNLTLSELRAREMMRNMKTVVGSRSSGFKGPKNLRLRYSSYGRGEILPNPNIKDYQKEDERRRIVMFYWSVLPDVGRIK